MPGVYVASKIDFADFIPETVPGLAEAEARYLAIEARFETRSPCTAGCKMKVALFVTCLVDQLCPQVGMATVEVLERAGCSVTFDDQQTCCGQPAFNTGYRNEARKFAKRFIEIFESSDAEAIVIPSGSCAAMVKHFHELFADEPDWRERADLIARRHTS
jgi:Fe-S oxidoreductase